jgi:hypothetical protein
MTIIAKTLAVLLLPATISLAHADPSQNCIVEGTVKNKTAEQHGTNVYVAFHSASDGAGRNSCNMTKGSKLAFKEPKNAMIENVPAGSEVRYHYTQEGEQAPQWQLMNVSFQ